MIKLLKRIFNVNSIVNRNEALEMQLKVATNDALMLHNEISRLARDHTQNIRTISDQVRNINTLNAKVSTWKLKYERAQDVIVKLKAELEPDMKKEFVNPKLRDLEA